MNYRKFPLKISLFGSSITINLRRVLLSSAPLPVQHKRATPFQPQNPSVPHLKPLSSTHPSVQQTPHEGPQFNIRNTSVQHRKPKNFGVELTDVGC